MLVVKKRLVKAAFDQGRLLDESDLTDDAVFRLIREDSLIRALATREIEDRNYLRPKPTNAELELQRKENLYWDSLGRDVSRAGIKEASDPAAGQPRTANSRGNNQESDYWKRHEDDITNIPPRARTAQQPGSVGEYSPDERGGTRGVGRERDLNRTEMESPTDIQPMMPGGTGSMPRATANDLPDLMRAAAASPSTGLFTGEQQGQQTGSGAGSIFSQGRGTGTGSSMSDSMDDVFDPRDRVSALSNLTNNPGLGEMSASAAGFGATSGADAASPSDRDRTLRADARMRSDRYSSDRSLRPPMSPQPTVRRKTNPYFNVPSLYDLYSQVSNSPTPKRFGYDLFTDMAAGGGNIDRLPMDVPVGPEYVIGPGDGITVQMWGSVSRRMALTVDRAGRVGLPEVGTVLVAGRSLGDVTQDVQNALRTQYRDVQADVSLSRLRAVRVYVVGEVKYPGGYELSGLSSPLNAVYTAGGPLAQGSLRHIRHMRGKQMIADYDAYDLILHGVNADVKSLQPGDSLVVGEAGPQVWVEGMVRRPAIYELRGEQSLDQVLELAGGVMSSGTLRHITVERLEAHEKRTMLSVDVPEGNNDAQVNEKLAAFKVQDGDHIRIAPIVAYADKTIYLDGHLFHPGKYAWHEGMKVSDVIKSYTDLLPEPYMPHAEIIRLTPPNFAPEVIGFNLGQALAKKDDLPLQAFDTIRVFSRFDFEDPPVVTVAGEVREPGDHLTNGATRISDAVYLAGGLAPDASTAEAQVYRKTADARMKVLTVDLGKALNGDPTQNIMLAPKDRVIIHKDQAKVDPPTVKVEGEVGKPGKYVLARGMTASQLIELAGGLKRSADMKTVDLARYAHAEDEVTTDHQELQLAGLMTGDPNADVPLRDGDVLSIRQKTGWEDRGATITLRGEVVHPGTYGIREGEKLSSVIERAGGFRSDAYSYGAVMVREQIRSIEERERVEMLKRVESTGDVIRGMNGDDSKDPLWRFTKDAAIQQWQSTLDKLRLTPPTGRMVIHITNDINHWAKSANDIEVRAGDVLTVPKKPNFIMISGSVYNPSAVSYRPGKSAEWYLGQGGGPTQMAKKSAMFVIHADGSVSGTPGALFGGGLRGVSVKPGDTVVVPEKAIAGPSQWQTVFQGVQAFSSIAVSAGVLATNIF
jgi:polysaccharide biosynthesis/export protein